MSQMNDESDSSTRMTRGRLRKTSIDQMDSDARPSTPSRMAKKMEPINESEACTPFKKNPLLAHVDSPMPIVQQSPRRSRRISASDDEALISSQIGRRTKILSTEVKSQSPAPKRRTRASSAEPSDDDAVIFVNETLPISRAARMKQRQSVILSPTVEFIAEDDELNISNELELRNRSISKSPASVYLSPKANGIVSMKTCSVVVSKLSIDDSENIESVVKDEILSPNASNEEEIFAVADNEEDDMVPLSQFVKNKIMEVEPMSPSQITRRSRLSMNESNKNVEKVTQERLSKSINDNKDKIEDLDESATVSTNGEKVATPLFSPEMFSEDDGELQETANVSSIIDRITSPKSKTLTPAKPETPSRLLKIVNSEVIDSSQQASSLAIQGRRSYREMSFSEMEGSPVRTNKSLITLSNSPHVNQNTPTKNGVESIAIEKVKTLNNKNTPLKVVYATPVKSLSTPMKISSSETPGKEKIDDSISMDISLNNSSDMDITLASLKKKSISKTPQPTKVETISKTLSKSWSQAIEANSSGKIAGIDNFSPLTEKKSVIKTKTPIKLIDTDTESENNEDDNEQKERSEFILLEAEEGEEDSMDSSERKYIEENEIHEEGADLGSEDTDDENLDEEEEDEDDSFIASDNPEIDDQYSLDSDEEVIELRKSRTKRLSRIIQMPESSDEEAVSENSPVKTPRKSPAKISSDVLNRKRKRGEMLDDSIVDNKKRAKLSDTILDATDESFESSMSDYEDALEKSIELDDDSLKTPKQQKDKTPKKSAKKESPMQVDEAQEEEQMITKLKKLKKARSNAVDMETILSKCNSILSVSEQEKKANKALKKVRKMEEKRIKLSLKAATEINTSSENKENTLKKKKYKKNLKQKAVEDVNDGKKEDMAATLSRFSEKLERKRLRKAEKKLEKKAQMELNAGNEVLEVEVAETVVKSDKKKKKKSKKEIVQVEEIVSEEPKTKKSKKQKSVLEEIVEPTESNVKKSKKKKKKKMLTEQVSNEIEEEVKQPSKKKLKRMALEEQMAEAPVVKEKSKKRKIQEISSDIDEHVPVLKKKLNVLKKIENPTQFNEVPQTQAAQRSNIFGLEELAKIPPPAPAGKIKTMIPKELDIVSKKRKRNTSKKSYAEPKNALPRPVWTSSGMFMEEPSTPFKFSESTYVALKGTGTSTEFGVMSFDGGMKRKQQKVKEQDSTAPMSFKTKAMFRKDNYRDGSKKGMAKMFKNNSC
ncbi:unnamed protein product [Diamesa serratosioi]